MRPDKHKNVALFTGAWIETRGIMVIKTKYGLGDTVYLRTDEDQKERIVTRIQITQGNVMYNVSCGTDDSWHYDFELSTERDLLKASTN